MILYPWGNKRDEVGNVSAYREVGRAMNAALQDETYRLMQSIELYPTTGGSPDIHHINDIMSFTLEIGQSFQPSRSQIDPIRNRVGRANMEFIDQVICRLFRRCGTEQRDGINAAKPLFVDVGCF